MKRVRAFLVCLIASQAFQDACCMPSPNIMDPWVAKLKKSAAQNNGLKITQTILGGVEAEPTPYFALISTSTKFCGGVLIYDDLVLSSASCTESPTEPISAAVGFYSSDQTTQYYIFNVPPEFIFLHPEYDCGNFNNDLSIIYLPGWVPYTEYVYPISLPYVDSMDKNYEGSTVYLSGFGSTSPEEYSIPNKLLTKEQEVIPMSVCLNYTEFAEIDECMSLCTASANETAGACLGDEGGPLVMESYDYWNNLTLIGIASFQPNICPISADFPSRHTKVAPYIYTWIYWFFPYYESGGGGTGGGSGGTAGGGSSGGTAAGGGPSGGGTGSGDGSTGNCGIKKHIKNLLKVKRRNKPIQQEINHNIQI